VGRDEIHSSRPIFYLVFVAMRRRNAGKRAISKARILPVDGVIMCEDFLIS